MRQSFFTYEIASRPRWDTLTAGLAVNLIGIAALILVGPRLPRSLPLKTFDTSHSVPLIAPAPTRVVRSVPPQPHIKPPQPQLLAKLAPPVISKPMETMKPTVTPKAEVRKSQPEKLPETAFASPAPAGPPKPSRPVAVKTDVFSSSGSESATVHKPAREVQTGGFGDPNGVHGTGDPKRNTVTVASVGSFDLPQGAGRGNGTGGSHGVSGTIRSAGFSDGVASAGPHGRGNGGGVVQGGFGEVVASGGGSAPVHAETKSTLEPVEILFKPRPAYTDEARRLRVQGEVLLEVVFEASGALRVNRVVRGLGHGLDEAALAAAQRIRFRPARRDGHAYDSAALVHIVFELAE